MIENPNIWVEYVHPDYIDYLKEERLRQTTKSLLQYSYEYKIINKKTGNIHLLHEFVYIENSVLFGITRDITEQGKLYRQNTQMKNFINSSEEVFWYGEADKNNNLIRMDFVNKSLYSITGIETDKFMNCQGTTNIWHEIVHKDDLKKFKEWNKLGEFEYRIHNQVTNKIVWLRVKNYINSNIKYGFIFDITEKKIKEHHRKILEFSINNMNDGFWIVKDNEPEGFKDDIEYVNDSLIKIFGLNKDEYCNNTNAWQNTIHPEDKQAVILQINSNSYPKVYKYRIIRPNDKQLRWISETVYLKGGYNYGIVKDITEQQLEKQKREYEAKIKIAEMKTELKIAAQLQESVLPKITKEFIRNEFELYAKLVPAKEMSGDFFDFFYIDKNTLIIVLADVMGKGITAAFYMSMAKAIIKNACYTSDPKNPGKILEEVNNILYSTLESQMFLTMYLVIYDIKKGIIKYSNAGHHGYIKSDNNGIFDINGQAHNIFAGFFDNVKYDYSEVQLNPGEIFVLFTDGIPDAENDKNETYGIKKLIKNLNHTYHSELDLRKFGNTIIQNTLSFQGKRKFDDITLVMLKRNI